MNVLILFLYSAKAAPLSSWRVLTELRLYRPGALLNQLRVDNVRIGYVIHAYPESNQALPRYSRSTRSTPVTDLVAPVLADNAEARRRKWLAESVDAYHSA